MSSAQTQHLGTDESRSPHEPAEDAPQAPGGAAVNRAATIATSAALGGAVSGALAGSLGGPVGAAVGAAVGALAAGLAGNAVAGSVDAKAEDEHWRTHYADRPYVPAGSHYDDYGPAYRLGVNAYVRDPGRHFDEVDVDLAHEWTTTRGTSALEWAHAREAARDAWLRAHGAHVRGGENEPE